MVIFKLFLAENSVTPESDIKVEPTKSSPGVASILNKLNMTQSKFNRLREEIAEASYTKRMRILYPQTLMRALR